MSVLFNPYCYVQDGEENSWLTYQSTSFISHLQCCHNLFTTVSSVTFCEMNRFKIVYFRHCFQKSKQQLLLLERIVLLIKIVHPVRIFFNCFQNKFIWLNTRLTQYIIKTDFSNWRQDYCNLTHNSVTNGDKFCSSVESNMRNAYLHSSIYLTFDIRKTKRNSVALHPH